MKNLKYALVAALVACTIMSLAAPSKIQAKEGKKIKDITIESAIKIPGLVVVMYQQLDPGFLSIEKPIYYVYVRYNLTVYGISGTHEQWTRFFKLKWKLLVNKNEPKGTN